MLVSYSTFLNVTDVPSSLKSFNINKLNFLINTKKLIVRPSPPFRHSPLPSRPPSSGLEPGWSMFLTICCLHYIQYQWIENYTKSINAPCQLVVSRSNLFCAENLLVGHCSKNWINIYNYAMSIFSISFQPILYGKFIDWLIGQLRKLCQKYP